MIRKEFTSEDRIKRVNHADLLEYGDFWADYIEIDPEDPHWFRAIGDLTVYPRNLDENKELHNATLEVTINWALIPDDDPAQNGLENLSAGEIFNLPWDSWICDDIPEEWEF